jgi:hypothetical protein
MLEWAVTGSKGKVVLISSACYSGGWVSDLWALLAAARQDEEALIVESALGNFHGLDRINTQRGPIL